MTLKLKKVLIAVLMLFVCGRLFGQTEENQSWQWSCKKTTLKPFVTVDENVQSFKFQQKMTEKFEQSESCEGYGVVLEKGGGGFVCGESENGKERLLLRSYVKDEKVTEGFLCVKYQETSETSLVALCSLTLKTEFFFYSANAMTEETVLDPRKETVISRSEVCVTRR